METPKKCSGCGLINFSAEMECRRCGAFLKSNTEHSLHGDRDNSGFHRVVVALTVFVLLGGGFWYWRSGTSSVAPTIVNEATTTHTPMPTPVTVLNVDPHDTKSIERLMSPGIKEKAAEIHQQREAAIEAAGKQAQQSQ